MKSSSWKLFPKLIRTSHRSLVLSSEFDVVEIKHGGVLPLNQPPKLRLMTISGVFLNISCTRRVDTGRLRLATISAAFTFPLDAEIKMFDFCRAHRFTFPQDFYFTLYIYCLCSSN